MCQPLPGPRCANHLAKKIDAVKKQLEANRDAFASETKIPHPHVTRATLMVLMDEYDETPTGQRRLAARIRKIDESSSSGRDTKAVYQTRKNAAKKRWLTKKAALAAAKAGSAGRVKAIMNYGPNAGWMENSEIFATSKNDTNYCEKDNDLGGISQKTTTLVVDHSGAPAEQVSYELVYETPVMPGAHPGLWETERDGSTNNIFAFDGDKMAHYTVDTSNNIHNNTFDPSALFDDITEPGKRTQRSVEWKTPEVVTYPNGESILRMKGSLVRTRTISAAAVA